MPSILDEIIPDIDELIINDIGIDSTPAVYKKATTAEEYDPETGDVTETVTSTNIKGIIDASKQMFSKLGNETFEQMFTVPAKSVTSPEVGDTIEIFSESWRVVAIKPNYTGELISTYDFGLNRG